MSCVLSLCSAEDIEINRKLLGKMLDRLGYSGAMVTIVNDGRQAAEAVEKEVARFTRRAARAAAAAASAASSEAGTPTHQLLTAGATRERGQSNTASSSSGSGSGHSSPTHSSASVHSASPPLQVHQQPFHLVLMVRLEHAQRWCCACPREISGDTHLSSLLCLLVCRTCSCP